jgi:hypothetical protein
MDWYPDEVKVEFDIWDLEGEHSFTVEDAKRVGITATVERSWKMSEGNARSEIGGDNYRIDRLIDKEAGVVLYVLREAGGGKKGGGISCLPLNQTALEKAGHDTNTGTWSILQKQRK